MAHYNLAIVDFKSNNILESIVGFEGLSMEFSLDAGTTVPNITIDGKSGPEVDKIVELATDLVVWRDEHKIFRGRLHYTQDNIGPNRHTVTLSSVDYRTLLDRRIFWHKKDYTNVDQSAIAWDFINYTQSQSGGDLGITSGSVPATSRLRTRDYEPGKSIGEALKQLSEVIDGFEYEIDADRRFNLYYPQRGTEKPFVLELGGSVESVTRTVSSSDFANAIRGHGDEPDGGTVPVSERFAANLTTAPEGRWEHNEWFPDVIRQTTTDNHTDAELQRRGEIIPSYSMKLKPNWWGGPDSLWLGDTVEVVVRSGRLNVVRPMRVVSVTITLDEDDDEEVHINVGRQPPAFDKRVRQMATRLHELERY